MHPVQIANANIKYNLFQCIVLDLSRTIHVCGHSLSNTILTYTIHSLVWWSWIIPDYMP